MTSISNNLSHNLFSISISEGFGKWHISAVDDQIIGNSREVELQVWLPGNGAVSGSEGDEFKSQGQAKARPPLFLCSLVGGFLSVREWTKESLMTGVY